METKLIIIILLTYTCLTSAAQTDTCLDMNFAINEKGLKETKLKRVPKAIRHLIKNELYIPKWRWYKNLCVFDASYDEIIAIYTNQNQYLVSFVQHGYAEQKLVLIIMNDNSFKIFERCRKSNGP